MQILAAEEGPYAGGDRKAVRLWNGDETDRGLRFYGEPTVVRVLLGKF